MQKPLHAVDDQRARRILRQFDDALHAQELVALRRLQKVEDGNTVTDFDPQEIERKISINLAIAFAPWRGTKINLLDCPGYSIFVTETECGLRAADAALLCVSGASGIEVMTEKVWEIAAAMGLPVIFNVTKLDRDALVQTLAVGAVKAGNDPHNQELGICLLDDYRHSTAADRDRLLLASAKHTAGHRKYGAHLDAWRRYADAFGLARA